jgi:isoquinoline 1-oxidoreductase subunit beta
VSTRDSPIILSRRQFMQVGAALSGGLVLHFSLAGCGGPVTEHGDGLFAPSAFIRIDRDGGVTLVMHKVEMGQGTYTSMPMLIAEELEVDLDRVRLEHAPPNDALYSEPLLGVQETGGSTSVRGNWERLRRAGATAREMLIAAAAETWSVDPHSCHASDGKVLHSPTGRIASYGELVDRAATAPAPRDVALKDPKEFKLIGTPAKRLDTREKVDGSARFGIDVRLPGMKYAAVKACPVFGGKLASVDDSKAKAIPGVQHVVRLDDAVAVIAHETWTAQRGLSALEIRWDEGANAKLFTADVVQQLASASQRSGAVAREEGDVDDAMARASRRVEAVYQLPFLAHATLEPINCTVHVQPDRCEIWVGTQVPTFAQNAAEKVTGLPREKIQVHNHLLGGGFGRRLEVDFIDQAVRIGQQVKGPVKITWSREEDIQHDMYRPYYYHRIAGGLDEKGVPVAWTHRITGSSILDRVVNQLFPKNLRVIRAVGVGNLVASIRGVDIDGVDGAAEPPYRLPNIRVEFVQQEPPGIPTAFWRGVGPTNNVFVVESFIDELAAAASQDPLAFRRALVSDVRARAVLDLAAKEAGWGEPLAPREGRGIALMHAFGTYLAEVAHVHVSEQGEVQVKRVVCAIDCGQPVNPDTIVAQMESGVVG